MTTRSNANLKVTVSNLAEEQMAKFVRGTTPWIVWLLGLPAGALLFGLLARVVHNASLVSFALAAAAAFVAMLVWRIDHSKGWIGRAHHAFNAVAGLGWIAAVVRDGWMGANGKVLIAYAVGGLTMTLTWNIRYSRHADGVEDVMTVARRKQQRVNWGYLVRLATHRAPAIRSGAERAAKVVPALAAPWQDGARPAVAAAPAAAQITAKDSDLARQRATAIVANFRDLTTRKAKDLNGARMRVLDVKPWRIRTEISLVRGVQTPKVILDARELMASQNALPLSSVIVKGNPKRHDRVFADFVLEDVLAKAVSWPGPHAVGESIAAAPTRFGVYEDRSFAERFGPAISDAMAKKLCRPAKNLSHLLEEGMNGSGKSSVSRLMIADGATRLDVEDWVIDTVKKTQTFGRLGQAIDWFATTQGEARAQVRFLADCVIPARADYLGTRGLDNWEIGCGLPYLRVTVEEGGIIANELDKLDAVLNSARSTGTEICLSVQRAHHALVDTNVRAAFGDTLSFGAKSLDDVFAMPDDMKDAGADPSVWSNKQPGMVYYGGSDLDLDTQLMQIRAFNAGVDDLQQVITEHEPARRAWIAANCPDWFAMLAAIDRNGVWAKRTTGASILATIERAEAKRAGQPVVDAVTTIAVEAATAWTTNVVIPDYPPEADDDEELVTMDELDLPAGASAEVADGVAEDGAIDPSQPIPAEAPADQVSFGRPPSDELDRENALGLLRGYLMRQGNGWEFSPRDLYGDLCPATGRSAGWIRTELGTTLVAEGLVEHDRAEGKYRVVLMARQS